MNMNNQNVRFGLLLLVFGVVLLIVFESWIPALFFTLVGGHRLFVGQQESSKDDKD